MRPLFRGIAAAAIALAAAVSAPVRFLFNGLPSVSKPTPRRPVGAGVPRRKPLLDPKVVRLMQLQAGIRPGMSRRRRRELARQFAKTLTIVAQGEGTTKNMSRAEVRRRQKAVASLIGNVPLR